MWKRHCTTVVLLVDNDYVVDYPEHVRSSRIGRFLGVNEGRRAVHQR